MQEELRGIEKNKTWELIKYSIKNHINMKWVYKLKLRSNGEIFKHKVILVARGFFCKNLISTSTKFMHLLQG